MSYVKCCWPYPPKACWHSLLVVFSLVFVGIASKAETPLPSAKILWKFSFDYSPFGRLNNSPDGRHNTGSSTPAVGSDGTIYMGTFFGTFFAVSPDGKAKWRFQAGLEIHSSPAIGDDGTIYFGSRDRCFYALNPNGALKWKFVTAGWVDSSPAIAKDGTIYFGSWDHNFYALSPDGSLKWKFVTDGIVNSSPAIAADGTIYFGSHDRNFYALNPDGSIRWKFETAGEIISSPAIGEDGVIYFNSADGNLYAINPKGRQCWRHHTGSWTQSSPVLDSSGNIAIGNTNGIDIISADGKTLCRRRADFPVGSSAVSGTDQFYAALTWRSLSGITTDGRAIWQARFDRNNVSASPTMGSSGVVYVCAENGLYALRPPENPVLPTKSAWPMFRGNAQHTGRAGGQKTEMLIN